METGRSSKQGRCNFKVIEGLETPWELMLSLILQIKCWEGATHSKGKGGRSEDAARSKKLYDPGKEAEEENFIA